MKLAYLILKNFYASAIFLIITFILNIFGLINAVNHWILGENGLITQKIDSPFYMREPSNLMTFLDQIHHNDVVETAYDELLRQRNIIEEQTQKSISFSMNLIDQAKEALRFFEIVDLFSLVKIDKKYLKRINLEEEPDYHLNSSFIMTSCLSYVKYEFGICCFNHLESLSNLSNISINLELELNKEEFDYFSDSFIQKITAGLETSKNPWKYHTLASYYWRMKGQAIKAIECAQSGILLAPRDFKDIAMLSLGTILYKASRFEDADIVLTAATDHAPDISKNHVALASTLAVLYDFNRSIEHFKIAKKLNPEFEPKIKELETFVLSLQILNRQILELYSTVEDLKKQVKSLKRLKNRIMASHEKMIQQQIPLGSRLKGVDAPNDKLLHRVQYCSTRTVAGSDKPILICDFYSELQMRLGSKEVNIDSIEKTIHSNIEVISKQFSTGFHPQFGFDKGPELAKKRLKG